MIGLAPHRIATRLLCPRILPRRLSALRQVINFSNSRLFTNSRLLQQIPNKKISKVTDEVLKIKRPVSEPPLTQPPPAKLDLTEDLWTVPNILTMSRIATTPIIGYSIVSDKPMMAISIFIYSCITDFLDGFIARRYNLKSIVGSIIDPMADKFLMTVCTVALSVQHIMPPYVALLIIGRDVILSFMGMWIRYKSLPSPKTFARFADVRIPTVSVHPNLLGKVNTGLQMVYIGGLVLEPGLKILLSNYTGGIDEFFSIFGGIVASTTFLSGLTYIFSNNAFKYIR